MTDQSLDHELAILHDGRLVGLTVDWIKREAVLTALTNDEGEPRRVHVRASGLAWLTMDPPTLDRWPYEYSPDGGPTLDAMAGLQGEGAPTALKDAAARVMTIFVQNWNSFIWIGAASFSVELSGPA